MTSINVLMFVWLSANVIGYKLVIDHDGGADDAIAIFEALVYEQYFNGPQVLAITTTHGNVPEKQAFINTQRILDIAERRDVPIYRGSNSSLLIEVPSDEFFGRDGLGDSPMPIEPIKAQPVHGALALIELTKKYCGGATREEEQTEEQGEIRNFIRNWRPTPGSEVKIVAIGSVTNIALAVRLDPNFLSRVATLYLADGRIRPTPKYNIEQDVEAYYIVAQAATPGKVTIVYYENQINITTKWRRNVLGALNTKKIQALNEFERLSLNSPEQAQFWYPLDPLVVAAALCEDVISEVRYARNNVTLCGEQRGLLSNNLTSKEEANVRVFYNVDSRKYQNLLYSIFAAEVK